MIGSNIFGNWKELKEMQWSEGDNWSVGETIKES